MMIKSFVLLLIAIFSFEVGATAQNANSAGAGDSGGNSTSNSGNGNAGVTAGAGTNQQTTSPAVVSVVDTNVPAPTPTPTPTEAQLISTNSLNDIIAASNAGLASAKGVTIIPKPSGVVAEAAPGRPGTSQFWYQPDEIKIVKVRGLAQTGGTAGVNGQFAPLVPLLSWCQGYWKGPETNGLKMDPTSPFSAGWGTKVPYDDVIKQSLVEPGTITYLNDIVVNSTNDLTGSIKDVPFEAGITRYELWLAKKPVTGGWPMWSWFFDSFCVVNPGGSVIGKLQITTADSLVSSNSSTIRTFRDSPYIVNALEDTAFMRAYSTNAANGETMLVTQPKMLVLLCGKQDDVATGLNEALDPVIQTAGNINTALNSTIPPRTYSTTGRIPGENGSEKQLAPNVSITDSGTNATPYTSTDVAKNWDFSSGAKTGGQWQFKRWQRGELLALSNPKQRSHAWVLEIKKDLLYSPQDKNPKDNLNAYLAAGANSYALGTVSNNQLVPVNSMIVAAQKVEAFDTGTILTGINNFKAGAEYSTVDEIPADAAINILPAGRHYPDSVILGVLQQRLLDTNNQILSPNSNQGWNTIKVFYWSSAQENAKIPYSSGDLNNAGVGTDHIPKQVVFGQSAGTAFNPYVDTWIIPLKDVSVTSAQYRVRFFEALPFKQIGSAGVLSKSGVGGVSYPPNNFTTTAMQTLLLQNSSNFLPINGLIDPAADAIASQSPEYKTTLGKVGLSGGGSYSPPAAYTPVDKTVIETNLPKTGGVVVDVAAGGALPADYAALLTPFGTDPGTKANLAQWFEIVPQGGTLYWSCKSPTVKVGVDTQNGGGIITK